MKKRHELDNLIKEAASAKDGTLVPAIDVAIDTAIVSGHDAEDVVQRCVTAGYSESYVRTTVSKMLRGRGVERRANGAGRPADRKAALLLEQTVKQYGMAEAKRILLASYRMAVKDAK